MQPRALRNSLGISWKRHSIQLGSTCDEVPVTMDNCSKTRSYPPCKHRVCRQHPIPQPCSISALHSILQPCAHTLTSAYPRSSSAAALLQNTRDKDTENRKKYLENVMALITLIKIIVSLLK